MKKKLKSLCHSIWRNYGASNLLQKLLVLTFVTEAMLLKKGSRFRVSRAVNQFSRYATEFNEFGVAFPIDALNATNLLHLHVLGTIWYSAFSKFLSVYLILEKKQAYGILRISDASDLLRRILDTFKETSKWKEREVKKLLRKTEFFIAELDSLIRHGASVMVDSDSSTAWLLRQ